MFNPIRYWTTLFNPPFLERDVSGADGIFVIAGMGKGFEQNER
jgi:hypothetical protein